MTYALTEEQDSLRNMVRRFLNENSPVAAARALHDRDEAFDRNLWRRMGAELGIHGIHLPEQLGGQGFGVSDLAIVLEEFGRVLVRSPYLISQAIVATVLADQAIEEQSNDLTATLAGIARGELVGTFAAWDHEGGWDLEASSLRARPSQSSAEVSGVKIATPFGMESDFILAVARDEKTDEVLLVLVDGLADGLKREHRRGLDITTQLAELDFHDVPARILTKGSAASRLLSRVTDWGCIALACEMIGSSQACLDMAVAYSLQREQFGRLIGSQQSIKHLCANVFVEIELARIAVLEAVNAWQRDDEGLSLAASSAKALASDAFLFAADASLHVHGGMGFTWEHDAHLFLRRARCTSLDFGDSRFHRDRFLALSGVTKQP